MNIIESIDTKFNTLTETQKKGALYIRHHIQDIAFSSIKELSRKSKVSEATLIRLSRVLGYEGYAQMQRESQNLVVENRTVVRLNEFLLDKDNNASWLEKHFAREVQNITHTMNLSQEKQIAFGAKKILEAKRVYIGGWRVEMSISVPLHYILNYMLGNAVFIEHYAVAETLANITGDDVLFLCGFPRYSRLSLKIAENVKPSGCYIITMTDSEISPFVALSDIALFAYTDSSGFLDSYTAAFSVLNALIKEVAYLDPIRVEENLTKTEENFEYFK